MEEGREFNPPPVPLDAHSQLEGGPDGTVYFVIPTVNEVASLEALVHEIARTMGRRAYRILIVDDGSTDGTQDLARSLEDTGHRVTLLERGARLGIGSAIRDGLAWSLGRGDAGCIVTMDGDLSHDPRETPLLLAELASGDLVQGSRYVRGGRILNWGWLRRVLSFGANALAHVLLRTTTKEHTTYFRAYSPRAAEVALRAKDWGGYEWALDSLAAVREAGLRIQEVPITFRGRGDGASKLTASAVLGWVRYLAVAVMGNRGKTGQFRRLPRFAAVGATGAVVNMLLLYSLVAILGLWPLLALSLALEASLLWNFSLNERWTFREHKQGEGWSRRLGRFHAVCALGFVMNVGVFVLLSLGFGVVYLIANLAAILVGFTANFLGSATWTWVAR